MAAPPPPGFALHTFNLASPAMFYMKEEGLEDLVDDVWLVEGSRLPVHSAIVSLRSAVLRDAYRTARDSGWPAQQAHGGPGLLPACLFEGSSVRQVALFLRLLYHPQDAVPASLEAAAAELPAVAALAHKFAAGGLLAALEEHLLQRTGSSGSPTLPEVGANLALAADLHMDRLLRSCAATAARLLLAADWRDGVLRPTETAMFRALQLGGAAGGPSGLQPSSPALALVLGALCSAVHALPEEARGAVIARLPAPASLAGWSRLQGLVGSFTWEAPGIAAAPGPLFSPSFAIGGGHIWQLQLDPGHPAARHAHLLLRLCNDADGRRPPGYRLAAASRLVVVNQSDAARSWHYTLELREFIAGCPAVAPAAAGGAATAARDGGGGGNGAAHGVDGAGCRRMNLMRAALCDPDRGFLSPAGRGDADGGDSLLFRVELMV